MDEDARRVGDQVGDNTANHNYEGGASLWQHIADR